MTSGAALLMLLLLCIVSEASGQRSTTTISITAKDSVITLPQSFIIGSSLVILVDSSITLRQGSDFTFDQERSQITLTSAARQLLFGGLSDIKHTITASYLALPLELKRSYSLYEPAPESTGDSSRRAIAPVARNTSSGTDFASSFQRSGAITRGFQLGSGRDLSLTSGFNLQFTGELAQDVVVTGALTEEQLPIQPEGNTQTLRELDRIYINLKASRYFEATFGDFYFDLNSGRGISRIFEQSSIPSTLNQTREWQSLTKTTFTSLSRKVLGVEALATMPFGAFTAGAASNKGRFTSNTIQGQEFFQGPYRLTGVNGERAAPVLAGTERVYVDGILQTRGERNDYVIDYATGELTFQTRRLITSASRITVDFEYAEQAYSRTLVVGQAQSMIVPGAVFLGATLLREGDNPDATLTLTLSDQDREMLRQAGNDPSRAFRSGVSFVGRTEAGRAKGEYLRVDTTIDGTPAIAYRYAPQDSSNALYSVSFGAVGQGRGAYTRRAITEFTFVGAGRGDYDTLVPLPFPQLTEVLGLNTVIRPFAGVTLNGEIAGSRHTLNRFAPLPNEGLAYRYSVGASDSLSLFHAKHPLGVRFRNEKIRPDFRSIDRINSVEFDRSYGYDLATAALRTQEYDLTEGRVHLSPFTRLFLDGSLSKYKADSSRFESDRLAFDLRLLEDTIASPEIIAHFSTIDLTNARLSDRSTWQRATGTISKTLRLERHSVTPYLAFADEQRESRLSGITTDSLTSRSFAFTEIAPGLRFQLGQRFTLSTDYTFRSEDSGRLGTFARVSNAETWRATLNLNNLSGFSTLLSFTYREKEYADSIARVRNGGDQQGILLRFEPRYSAQSGFLSVDALYEISNQRTARIERLFFPVQRGYGNYKYLGDLNGNGRADVEEFTLARYSDEGEYILITLPSEQLFPTSDLRTSLRFRLSPASFLGSENANSILAGLSSETLIRLEERSTLENESAIFFLDLSKFRQDSTTLAGLYELDQAFNLFENNPVHSYRLRFYERTMAQQYTTGLERTYRAERSLRGRFRLSSELTNETTARSITDLALTRSQSYTQPYRVGGYAMETDWSFHPLASRIDYGFRGELVLNEEQNIGTRAVVNAFTIRASYSLESRTRLRAELQRDELTIKDAPDELFSLPYALTNGRTAGITWIWRLALDYNFGAGVIATLAYDARNVRSGFLSKERETIHNARAEVRAAF